MCTLYITKENMKCCRKSKRTISINRALNYDEITQNMSWSRYIAYRWFFWK